MGSNDNVVSSLGQNNDLAVGTDSAGSINAHLRGLVKLVAAKINIATVDMVTTVSAVTGITNALPPGEYHMGEMGGKGIPVSISFTRPANGTAYTAKDAVGVSLAVSGATNATPIVMTTGTHGLADGDYVTQAAVGGNTAAVGSFYVKRTGYSDTTYALYSDKVLTTPVAGNGAYTSGGTVARLFRLPNAFRVAGGNGYVTKIRAMTDLSTFVDRLVFHFYGAPVPAILDNAAFTLLWANRTMRMGPAIMAAMTTEGSGSDSTAVIATPGISGCNLPLFVQNSETPAAKDLWFAIEDLDAGTPGSAQNFYIEVTLDAN